MTIPEIKEQLDIIEVAQSLGIEIGKGNKACCPFHPDKTPSLQFSIEKQIATCFSSNCTAGTMDVIDLTAKKLSLSTHEAINHLSRSSTGILSNTPKAKKTPVSATNLTALFKRLERGYVASPKGRITWRVEL